MDDKAMQEALGGQNLLTIYGVYEKLKQRGTAATEGDNAAQEGRPATPSGTAPAGATGSSASGGK
jgi:small glutamine-rich tetratricopeptide repeat-containing protein alpha